MFRVMNKINKLTISTFTGADAEATVSFFKASISNTFEQEGVGHLQEDIKQEIEKKRKLVLASLDPMNLDTYFLIAKVDETIVGAVSFGPCGEDIQSCTEHQLDAVGELGSLYVLPSYQGQGLGSALIKEMLNVLQEQGIHQFCLDSGYKRAQARWLRKFGDPYKVIKDYWGPDTVHMVWLCNVSDYL
jgi:GNAT superfamily N-acetyltransferase